MRHTWRDGHKEPLCHGRLVEDLGDIIAQTDQAARNAEEIARIISAFYRGCEMDEQTQRAATILYTRKMLGSDER
jgi:predicted HD phosphohydrolase